MAVNPAGTTIDETRVRAFSESVHMAAQQKKSRTKDISIIKYFKGKDMSYDGYGTVEATDANARFAKLDFADLEHNRRQILPNRWQVTLPFDGRDAVEQFLDPKNGYEQVVANAMMRRWDRTGIAALLASVNTGEDYGTAVTPATDGVLEVDATTGLTYEKILEARQNFIDNDLIIDEDMDKSFMVISGKEHTQMMSEVELTSGDFNREYFVEKGSIQKAAGFDIIKYAANATNPILSLQASDAERQCIAFTEGALCYGVQEEIALEVRKLDDYINTFAVIATGSFGAVRTEGKRVQQITTTV